MNKNDNINYAKATFSVAMIDFKTYTEVLLDIDKQLEQANFVLGYVLKQKEQTEELKELLNEHAFTEFAKVQKYLKEVKKSILKYKKKLKVFLQENSKANEEFYAQLDILIPIVEEKEKFVNEQIKKCFDYFKEFNDAKTL